MTPAVFSPCRRYRYVLEREVQAPTLFSAHGPPAFAVFVCLNPSTADEVIEDATIRKVKAFALRWGHTHVRMLNMYAWRSTDPEGLWKTEDPVGPENDKHLLAGTKNARIVICAWGKNAKPERERAVVRMLREAGRTLFALARNDDLTPSHPLYLPAASKPLPYDGERAP